MQRISTMSHSINTETDSSLFSKSTRSTSDSVHPPTFKFVIGGGSYAAIHAVKLLCKHIIPKMVQQNPAFKATITVIAPNKESYWNVAAVRLISDPELLEKHADQIFFPLEATLRQYLPNKAGVSSHVELEVIQGKLMSIDSELNMLTYMKMDDAGVCETGTEYICHTAVYNALILATGASSSSPAFKLNGSTEQTKAALRKFQQETAQADSICVVGAGGVGVELAGELGYKYGNTKRLTLFSAFEGTLERLKPSITEEAVHKLEALGVDIVLNYKAVSARREKTEPSSLAGDPLDPAMASEDNWVVDTEPFLAPENRFSAAQSSDLVCTPLGSPTSIQSVPTLRPSTPTQENSTHGRTTVAFENGEEQTFDCYIPATGNIPNSGYLPRRCLDPRGYVRTDPYLRMAHANPASNIYVYGDLVAAGSQTLPDLCEAQTSTLKATLLHDLLTPGSSGGSGTEHRYELKMYKRARVTYYVPISCKDGVGQTMYGMSIPGFVVAAVKGKTFRIPKAKRYLTAQQV